MRTRRRPPPCGPLLAALLLLAAGVRADGIIDVTEAVTPPFSTNPNLFPNWVQAPTAAFQIAECDDAVCTGCLTSSLNGLTVVNYGTATSADLAGVSFRIVCGATNLLRAMTYAGVWNGTPAWTWGGPALALPDGCVTCGCALGLYLYTDIAPCPTDGASVILGPGFNDVLNPGWPGGVTDSCGYAGPWSAVQDQLPKTIRYVAKEADRTEAAPGDTVNYTVYYGRPGTGTISTIWVTDSLPPTMHYAGAGVPLPDTGFDPDPGPPLRLRWTITPVGPTAGGPTGAITFQASVDWGNGELFEPGSGDVAAQEGAFLFNRAHLAWDPAGGCAPGRTSNVPSLVVRRYLFWMIGDNDVIFAPRMGMPDDEIIYSVFIRNTSATKTWWNVHLWDTVPGTLDPWSAGEGFDDPCAGWTMTPTGCAAASPGRTSGGGTTLLTWAVDLPPLATLTLRWQARVIPTASPGATAINRLSVLAYGKTGILDGTGHAVAARSFTHQAQVVLRTTYTSYVGWAGAALSGCSTPTYHIVFYPLNKAADGALYRQWCCTAAPCNTACGNFALNGGVSPRIDVFAGTCTGGPPVDWQTGCKVERAPARYIPAFFAAGAAPPSVFNFVHKLVANAPFIWELANCFSGGGEDADTLAGTTSLTYNWFIAYTYARVVTYPNVLETLYMVNTDPVTSTTLHVFQWNPATLVWDYITTQDLYQESGWAYVPSVTNHYRILSSDAPIIVHKAYPGIGQGGAFNDFGTLFPNRENGNLVNSSIPANFYFWAASATAANGVIVGNVGAVKASYQVFLYKPFNPALPSPSLSVTSDLVDSAGSWQFVGTDTVDPGLAAPLNPHIYGAGYDTGIFTPTYKLYRLTVTGGAGAAVQLWAGIETFSGYSGGAVVHSSNPAGQAYGREYWVHEGTTNNDCKGNNWDIMTINVYSPKVNLGVTLVSHDGYSSTYTTNDVDEAISFKDLTTPGGGTRRNWRVNVTAGGNPGDVIMQYIACIQKEKFYAAPFLSKGVFYAIIAPPAVFVGQSFWVTIVVIEAGATKQDYCGTSSFTSTDPNALIQGTPMDTYNFTWSSDPAFGNCDANGGAANENGVRIFLNVSLSQLGLQTLVASDTVDGSITGLTTIMVVGADVRLEKRPRLSVQASGDTVRFQVCWSNYSSASAFSFVITDAVPMGTTFVPEATTAPFDCGSTDGVVPVTASSGSTSATVPPAASFAAGNPPAGTRWLRWTLPMAGVQTTGCVCFRVSVN